MSSNPVTPSEMVRQNAKRQTHNCFICGKAVQKLTQHLRHVHGLTKAEADKQVIEKKQVTKRKRRHYRCSVCSKPVTYLLSHLRRLHKLSEEEALIKRSRFKALEALELQTPRAYQPVLPPSALTVKAIGKQLAKPDHGRGKHASFLFRANSKYEL